MPRFIYTAYTPDGRRETGETSAASLSDAYAGLAALGLTVSGLEPRQAGNSTISSATGRKVPAGVQAELAEQMAAMFAAGIPALRIVEIIAQTTPDVTLRRHFGRMARLMADGQPFATSLAQASGRQMPLSPLFVTLAEIGQETGQTGAQYPMLAKALRARDKLTNQLRSALIYPALLLFSGCLLLGLMAIFLAPRLEGIFHSVNRPPPPVISAFTSLADYWHSGFLPLGLGLLAALSVAVWRTGFLTTWTARHLPRVPVVGPVVQGAELASAIRSLGVMLPAGIALPSALSRVSVACQTPDLARMFQDASDALVAGERAHGVLTRNRAVPALIGELFRVGEETNTLSKMLDTIAATLELEVERRLQRLMALLTPVLTLIVGGGVALLVVSIMGAILSINDLAI